MTDGGSIGEDLAALSLDFGLQIITSSCVELPYLDDRGRRAILESCGLQSSLVTVCELLNKYDQAERTSRGRVHQVEADFLGTCASAEAKRALVLLRTGRCLLSSATLVQFVREIIEWCPDGPTEVRRRRERDAFLEPDQIFELIVSINKHHELAFGLPDFKTQEELSQFFQELAGDQERMQDLESRSKLWEFARLQTNTAVLWDVILSDTYQTWFKKWPEHAAHDLIGDSPEIAFQNGTGVDLVELISLGRHLWLLGETGALTFTRDSLIESQFSEAVLGLAFGSASLAVQDYRSLIVKEREEGDVSNRRYTFGQFPILQLSDESYLILRPSWAAERFCGQQLYWQAFADFGGPRKAAAKQLSGAMDLVFERNVDYVLRRVHKKAPHSFDLINERQMQQAWRRSSGPPSVCDWALWAGDVCVLIDANNHRLNFSLAQGLADEGNYSEDLEKSTLRKIAQFRSTADSFRANGWDGSELGPGTLFVPIIVVPNAGLPMTSIGDVDLAKRAKPIFDGSDAIFANPGTITWQELQLLEALCDSRNPSGFIELVGVWRKSCTLSFPVRLQTFLDQSGLDRPIGKYPKIGRRLLEQKLDARGAA